jgi:hypothetical protein
MNDGTPKCCDANPTCLCLFPDSRKCPHSGDVLKYVPGSQVGEYFSCPESQCEYGILVTGPYSDGTYEIEVLCDDGMAALEQHCTDGWLYGDDVPIVPDVPVGPVVKEPERTRQ